MYLLVARNDSTCSSSCVCGVTFDVYMGLLVNVGPLFGIHSGSQGELPALSRPQTTRCVFELVPSALQAWLGFWMLGSHERYSHVFTDSSFPFSFVDRCPVIKGIADSQTEKIRTK